VKLKRIAKKTF